MFKDIKDLIERFPLPWRLEKTWCEEYQHHMYNIYSTKGHRVIGDCPDGFCNYEVLKVLVEHLNA